MAKKIHFPKGEGIKIIQQASEAKEKDSIYILAVDETYAEMIVVSVSGAKRKIGFRLPENIGLTDIINDDGDVTTEGSVYLKEQVDKFLADLEDGNTTIANTLETLKGNLENHIDDTNNPHGVTASQIGLGNVDNTSDADKPISNAQEEVNNSLLESITEVEDLANNKLSKTTAAIAAPTSEFKYIYLTNEQNETRRMLAGDLGKNVANSTLVSIAGAGFIQGANWTHDTAGFHYFLKGLPNKYADQDFNKKLVMDANGRVALSEREDITLNIPETFTGSATLGSTTINVNHIYPSEIPERPNFADEIRNIMANYKNIDFIPITQTDWELWTKGNKGLSVNTIDANGIFSLSGNNSEFNDYTDNDTVVSLTAPNIVLPNDKDWILKIKCSSFNTTYHGGMLYAGVSRNINDNIIPCGLQGGGYDRATLIGDGVNGSNPYRYNILVLIIKVGGVISSTIYGNGKCCWNTINAYTELGDYIPKTVINKNNGSISGSMAYKILN